MQQLGYHGQEQCGGFPTTSGTLFGDSILRSTLGSPILGKGADLCIIAKVSSSIMRGGDKQMSIHV